MTGLDYMIDVYEAREPLGYYADDFYYEICNGCNQPFDPEWEETERGTDDKALLFCCGGCKQQYEKKE